MDENIRELKREPDQGFMIEEPRVSLELGDKRNASKVFGVAKLFSNPTTSLANYVREVQLSAPI